MKNYSILVTQNTNVHYLSQLLPIQCFAPIPLQNVTFLDVFHIQRLLEVISHLLCKLTSFFS